MGRFLKEYTARSRWFDMEGKENILCSLSILSSSMRTVLVGSDLKVFFS
jgi:hypothetical protein